MKIRTKKEENNSYLQNSKTQAKANTYIKTKNQEQGITLIALVVTNRGTFDFSRNYHYFCARRKWNHQYGTKGSRCNQ